MFVAGVVDGARTTSVRTFIYILYYTIFSSRIGIVTTTPSLSTPPSTAAIIPHQPNYSPIRPSNHTKAPRHYHETTPSHHPPPPPIALLAPPGIPIVVQPHTAHRLETDESPQEGADEGYQAAEIGDGAGDDVGYAYGAGGAEEPGYVVGWGRGG